MAIALLFCVTPEDRTKKVQKTNKNDMEREH